MIEQFVTYEIARLLESKGFDRPCLGLFYKGEFNIPRGFGMAIVTKDNHVLVLKGEAVLAPLWQQVIDWLVDKYKIEVSTSVGYEENNKEWRSFNIIILEGGPISSDVHFFEEHIYGKTRREIINEYFIPEALKLIP